MFKVGDWCYNEFELKIIKNMVGEEVEEVSTGYLNLFGRFLTCFPLTLEIKMISENFKFWEDEIRKKDKEVNANLNWPGIHGRFVDRWEKCCEAHLANKPKEREKFYEDVEGFAKKWINKLSEEQSKEIDGIPIFRR